MNGNKKQFSELGLLRGFGQSALDVQNSASDNYSYYVRDEEQESYKHKNASWDPTRSFLNQYNDSVKRNRDIQNSQNLNISHETNCENPYQSYSSNSNNMFSSGSNNSIINNIIKKF